MECVPVSLLSRLPPLFKGTGSLLDGQSLGGQEVGCTQTEHAGPRAGTPASQVPQPRVPEEGVLGHSDQACTEQMPLRNLELLRAV